MNRARQQYPRTARFVGDGLKLHRRSLRLDHRIHTVISLRPGTTARFSTNYFHGTWHLLSDDHGSRLLATLLWGLAYQARPGTVLVIDRPFLIPTPFEADPADPILLVPGWCTRLTPRATRDLLRRLPLRDGPDGTVRWRTHGLTTAADAAGSPHWERGRGRTERVRGAIVVTPSSPGECRDWALSTAAMDTGSAGTDYNYLDHHSGWVSGEVQTFRRFRQMVGTARRARGVVLHRAGPAADPGSLRSEIWEVADAFRGRAHLKICEWRDGQWRVGRYAADLLAKADVREFEDLRRMGAAEAYRRMLAAGADPDTRMLWAMDCAISGSNYRYVSSARRAELLAALGPVPDCGRARADSKTAAARRGKPSRGREPSGRRASAARTARRGSIS
ncbi:TfoX/Sxy family DNA transformation protein [Nocardia sp. NPDC003963]